MATSGKEYKLAVRIAGVIDKSFSTSLAGATAGLKTFTRVNSDLEYLNKGYTKIMNVGKKAFRVVSRSAMVAGAAIGAATVQAIKSGVEFESAFAGVTKTVDASSQQLAQLRENIIEMSKTIPATASEIAGTMEIAGQLGIATESLTDFTETMIKLGVSTNMSAEDASIALARFANITQMADFDEKGISNWERLGSTVVDLGNNFETTEEEIVTMATRLASTGHIVGLTEAQILALSTAMSSVGIRAEAGGSTMAKLLKKMQLAVETGSGALNQFASVSNMTGEQFQKTFKEDATVALRAFIGGLNDTERNGKSTIAILKDMKLDEVRLSNTIQSLAGAENVLGDALDRANKAWGENNALSIEAEKRFQTVESQAQLLKQNLTALAIESYDAMRPLLVEVLGSLNTKLRELTSSNSVRDWIHNISTSLPVMGRNFLNSVKPVFDGFIAFIKWIKDNGITIISVISGIAASLASFKIVYTISQVIEIIGKLNATIGVSGSAIMMIIGLIGIAVGLAVKLRAEWKKTIDQNIADHFGDIALSLKEVKELAGGIINSENINHLRNISSEIDKLKISTEELANSSAELDKYKWIRDMGIQLNENQIDSYKTAIESYVNDLQSYVEQRGYTVSVALAPLADSNDPGVSRAIENINNFYANTSKELAEAGAKLKDAVNAAYEDGLLTPDEEKVIRQAEGALARIQQQITTDKLNAKMQSIAFRYSGAALNPESFKAMQDELNSAVIEIQEKAAEALELAYAEASHAGANKNKLIKAAESGYFKTVLEAQAQSINFQVRSIYQAYGDELEPAIAGYIEQAKEVMNSYANVDWGSEGGVQWYHNFNNMINGIVTAAKDSGLTEESRAAIGQLLESLAPTIDSANESIERMRQSGVQSGDALVQGMQEAIGSYNLLASLVGNTEASGDFASSALALTPQLQEFFNGVIDAADTTGATIMNERAGDFLKGAQDGIARGAGEAIVKASKDASIASSATEGANNIKNTTEITLNNIIGNLKATSVVDVTVTAGNIDTSGVTVAVDNAVNNATGANPKPKPKPSISYGYHANGGFINHEMLSMLGEQGPEVVIPLNRTLRASSLWEKTGELLGMDSILKGNSLDTGSSGANITYSPTLQFNGDAPSKRDIKEALRMSQTEFERMMEQYLKKQSRIAF